MNRGFDQYIANKLMYRSLQTTLNSTDNLMVGGKSKGKGNDKKKKKNKKNKKKKDLTDREIEWRWIQGIDIQEIRRLLKKNNAEIVYPKTIMPLMVFSHPTGNKDSYIRIRYEGTHISMTSKTNLKSEYVTEYEVAIDSFEQGIKILKSLGCKKRYYLEKLRETWKLPGCKEIVIDSYPGTMEYLEIDAHSEKALKATAKLLGLKKPSFPLESVSTVYGDRYGITTDRELGDLTFKNALKQHGKYITKNRKEYEKIIKEQQKYYKTLKFDVKTIHSLINEKD